MDLVCPDEVKDIQEAVQLSKTVHVSAEEARLSEQQYNEHTQRIKELLDMNNLTMLEVYKDGDCFFASLCLMQSLETNPVKPAY